MQFLQGEMGNLNIAETTNPTGLILVATSFMTKSMLFLKFRTNLLLAVPSEFYDHDRRCSDGFGVVCRGGGCGIAPPLFARPCSSLNEWTFLPTAECKCATRMNLFLITRE